MELASASGANKRLVKFIRDIGERRTSVNEIVCHKNGKPTHSRQRIPDHWTEHFSLAYVVSPTSAAANPREVSVDPLTEVEVELNM